MLHASTSTWDATIDFTGGAAILLSPSIGVAVGIITAGNFGFIMVDGIHPAVSVDSATVIGSKLVAPATTNGLADLFAQASAGTPTDLEFELAASSRITALTADVSNLAPCRVRCY